MFIYTVYTIHVITAYIMYKFLYNIITAQLQTSVCFYLSPIITHDKNTIAGMCGTLLRFVLRFNYSLIQPTMFFRCIIFEV